MLPFTLDVDVGQVEDGDVVGHDAREPDLRLGVEEGEAQRVVDDGAHDGFWVRVRPVQGVAREGFRQRRHRDERAVGRDDEAVAVPRSWLFRRGRFVRRMVLWALADELGHASAGHLGCRLSGRVGELLDGSGGDFI